MDMDPQTIKGLAHQRILAERLLPVKAPTPVRPGELADRQWEAAGDRECGDDAAMSWVACCQEKAMVSVAVAALGDRLFDAEVTLIDEASLYLRVALSLKLGPRLRTLVEPVHP